MKVFNKVLLAVLLFSGFGISHAGNTTGTVNEVYVLEFKEAIIFSMNSSNPSFDECATNSQYAVSTSSEQGKIVFSAILAAKASNQTIKVHGKANNACAVHGGAEDLNYLIIK